MIPTKKVDNRRYQGKIRVRNDGKMIFKDIKASRNITIPKNVTITSLEIYGGVPVFPYWRTIRNIHLENVLDNDLTFIKSFPNLESIHMYDCAISLKGLEYANDLEVLVCGGRGHYQDIIEVRHVSKTIRSLSLPFFPALLNKAPYLRNLCINSSELEEIHLSSTCLKTLQLQCPRMTSISLTPESLKSLRVLSLNRCYNLSEDTTSDKLIRECSDLREITIVDTDLPEVLDVHHLPNLRHLNIFGVALRDIKANKDTVIHHMMENYYLETEFIESHGQKF